jgi:hypothetical protein
MPRKNGKGTAFSRAASSYTSIPARLEVVPPLRFTLLW